MAPKRSLKVSPARGAALDVLTFVQGGAFAEEALLDRLDASMGPKDRALATELSYGTLRWKWRLDSIIRRLSSNPGKKIKPTVLDILRLGVFQLFLLDRIPDHAAVNEAVEQAKAFSDKRSASFVNGLLRSALKNKATIDPDPGQDPRLLSEYYSHPQWLVRRWISQLGPDKAIELLRQNNSRPSIHLRTNTLLVNHDEIKRNLIESGLTFTEHPGVDNALILDSPGAPIHELPGFKEGLFSVQNIASQLVSHIVAPLPGERILDACSAPGGKTAHLAALAENKADIVAVDVDPGRVSAMKDNLKRLGVNCVKTVVGDASDSGFIRSLGQFDRILVDPSCSNLGTLRHNPEVKYRIKEGTPQERANQQVRILRAVSPALKPGGALIYSVCTVTQEETISVIRDFLDENKDFELSPLFDITSQGLAREFVDSDGFYSTFAKEMKISMDGFFAARLIKSSNQ